MGVRREDSLLEQLDYSLRFAVRADGPGIMATDYHTVSGYHRTAAGDYRVRGGSTLAVKSLTKAREFKESTIISLRDYLHDARFLIVLGGEDEMLLRQLAGEAPHPDWPGDLGRPRWPMYLGRKSCVPTRPVLCRLTTEYRDLRHALFEEHWNPPRHGVESPATLDGWIECSDGDQERQDALRVNEGRFYGFRRCQHVEIPTSSLPRGS